MDSACPYYSYITFLPFARIALLNTPHSAVVSFGQVGSSSWLLFNNVLCVHLLVSIGMAVLHPKLAYFSGFN